MNTVIRGTLLAADGQRLPTCGQPGEYTYGASSDADANQRFEAASVAAPTEADAVGLIVWNHLWGAGDLTTRPGRRGASWQVEARFMTVEGCVYHPVFPIRDAAQGVVMSAPAVAALGMQRFVVVWVEGLEQPSTHLRAVVLEPNTLSRTLLDTVNPVDGSATHGEPVDLVPSGPLIHGVSATPIGDGCFALAWMVTRLTSNEISVRVAIYNGRLEEQLAPMELWKGDGHDNLPDPLQTGLAFDGTQLLVAWQDFNDSGQQRVYARFMTRDGKVLSGPSDDSRGPFRIGSAEDGNEKRVSLTSFPSGGFLAAWQEHGVSGRADASDDGLRLTAFNRSRKHMFLNAACDAGDIQLNQTYPGAQTWPSLTMLSSGTAIAVWTDAGSNDIVDRSSSSVHGVALDPRQLFALE